MVNTIENQVYQAIRSHDVELMKEVSAWCLSVNFQLIDPPYWTPLQDAIDELDYEMPLQIVELLISKGADVNIWHPSSVSPLMMALVRNQYEAARLLIEVGADTNDGKDEAGNSPLLRAVRDKRIDIVKLLLENGATDTIDKRGGFYAITPLCYAVESLDVPMIRLLLNAGANPNATDEGGLKPIEYLPKHGNLSLKPGIERMIERATHERKYL